MNSMELPLVFFTVLAQASIGMIAVGLTIRVAQGPVQGARREWFAAGVILAVAMVASLFHLGHPEMAIDAVKHVATAWLSREIIGTSTFLGLVAIGVLVMRERFRPVLGWLTALVGLLTIFFMGMTYAPPSFPALNNALPLAFYLLTAAILGPALLSWFAPQSAQSLLGNILAGALLLALAIYLLAPTTWLSGGAVMAITGRAWLGSPVYWARIVFALALPLVVIWKTGRIPAWLPVLLLLGELAGRIVFFSQTMHTAMHLGLPY